MKPNKKPKHSNWLKLLLQFGVLAAIVLFVVAGSRIGGTPTDPEAYCPFGGLQALGSYFLNNSLACTMSMVQIMMGIALAVGIILFSQLFCGYLCPLGTVSEWMGKAGRKLKVNYDIPQGSIADKALRLVKYVLLFIIFYMSVSSSELFCKNLDPYYAMATGFKGEITAWMAAISVALLFLGNFFVKMFWCKYICPLGALSHIFKFTLLFAVIALLIWVSGIVGLANGWVWALGLACVASYVMEITCRKTKIFPLLKITRDEQKCTNCGLCTKKCPYTIPVAKLTTVRHIDCTMCGDCISSCNFDALAVNKRKSLRWVPGLIAIVLFIVAIILGNTWELPTIDERWGDWENVENMQVYEKDGLTSVKCYGSAMAFSSKMNKVAGIHGVRAYVSRNAVEISYNPAVTDTVKIMEAIFTPTIMKFSNPPVEVETLRVIKIGVDQLFDNMDMVYLGNILRPVEGIYGFEANFACPVDVLLYTDPSVEFTRDRLEDLIEVKETTMGVGENAKVYKVRFKVMSYDNTVGTVTRMEFVNKMFIPTAALSREFVDNAKEWGSDEFPKAVYEIAYPGVEKPIVSRFFAYFTSFLSQTPGILKIDVALRETTPVLRLTYVASMWDDEKIWNEILQAPMWKVKYNNGDVKEEKPRFSFTEPGHTVVLDEVVTEELLTDAAE